VIGRLRHKLRGGSLGFDAALTSLVGMGVYALSAVTGPLLARALGTTARGDLASVLVPTQVLGYLILWGLPHASAFYVARIPRRTLVMTGWVIMVAVNLPLVLLGALFVPAYLSGHDPVTVPFFYAFLGQTLVFLPMITTLDCLRGEGRAVPYNLLRAAPFVLNTFFIVTLFVLDELTLESALVSQFTANAIAWTAVFVYAGTFPGRGFDRSALRTQFDYGWRSTIGLLSQMIVGKFDQFLLVPLVDSGQLGLYVVAATGASLTAPLGQGVGLALFPHARRAERGRADDQTRTALKLTALISVVAALVVGLMAPWVIPLLFGSDFAGAVAPLLILLPGQVFMNLGNIQAARLEADGRPGAASRAFFAGAVITVVGVLIAVPIFGIEGAAFVTSVSQAVFLIVATLARRAGGESIERPTGGDAPAPVEVPGADDDDITTREGG